MDGYVSLMDDEFRTTYSYFLTYQKTDGDFVNAIAKTNSL